MSNVDIIVVGNEILLGAVQDTNSNYLCRVVTGRGSRVAHIAVVSDDLQEIAAEVRNSISRSSVLIFTCGGLGPTHDDLTLHAVAEAAGVATTMNTAAKQFVENKYRKLAEEGLVKEATMNEGRLKMACLPDGADMIENPAGTAPAAALRIGASLIICLPGVPMELKAIVEGPLDQLLSTTLGPGSSREREIIVECGDESVLAPVLKQVQSSYPGVYLKSRPSGFSKDERFRVLLSATGSDQTSADSLLDRAAQELTRALYEAGINSR